MPIVYSVPDLYYARLHHIRPRFKNNVESVLIYVASEIASMGEMDRSDFCTDLDRKIRAFPGNAIVTEKTIRNWRTEISSLFGFIEPNSAEKTYRPGRMAIRLAESEDLVEFFKYFLYFFQYPGGHLKPDKIIDLISEGIRYRPVPHILQLLSTGAEITGNEQFKISKAELTHCVFNDLRVTRDHEPCRDTVERILDNRRNRKSYDNDGDIIRYAGDILDYMVLANLLDFITYGNGDYFYLNRREMETIASFISSQDYFDGYDEFYSEARVRTSDITAIGDAWFNYVNSKVGEDLFQTDLLSYIGIDKDDFIEQKLRSLNILEESVIEGIDTKKIGDIGEALIFNHECQRLKNDGAVGKITNVKIYPNHLALGYDIQSFESYDELKRLIEVKTTISHKDINFNKFHLTENEWGSAQSFRDRYFVYRLQVSKTRKKLFIIQDPDGAYKTSRLDMRIRDGADITFDENSGTYAELLEWVSS